MKKEKLYNREEIEEMYRLEFDRDWLDDSIGSDRYHEFLDGLIEEALEEDWILVDKEKELYKEKYE